MTNRIYLGAITIFVLVAFAVVLPSEAAAQGKKKRRAARNLAAQGDVFYRQKRYNEAIDKYSQAIAIMDRFPFAHFSKGYAHYYLKQYGEAISELGIALDQGYNPLEVYAVRWRVHFLQKNWRNALSDIKNAQERSRACRIGLRPLDFRQ